MPFGTEGKQKGIALSLSGGGFRATLFHLGALWRLNELKLLQKIDRIASVSGGSITAGLLAKEWAGLRFDNGLATRFEPLIVMPLREFCTRTVDALAIGEGLLLPWKSVSEAVQDRYEKHLYGGVSLQQLPDRPRFVFMATNLQTGRAFRFSKPYAGDYRLGLIRHPVLPLSLAVTASSAFPPVLSPVILQDLPPFDNVQGADLHGDPRYTEKIFLTDGGAYDNLGLETVWDRFDTILVSDAGAPFKVDDDIKVDWLSQARAALDIATDQSRALRKRALIADFRAGVRAGAFWGIDTKIGDYSLPDALPCRDDLVLPLAKIRTRLNPFSDEEQGRLINWGYALCDTALRKHGAAFVDAAARPKRWPVPDQALGDL